MRVRKMQYRNFLLKTLFCTCLLLLVVAGLNYVVDPLQFYRKAVFYTPSFSTEQRYQNPGLARNYKYDTIILGSSMAENFVPSYVNGQLGVKSVKLAMSGASAHEEKLMANVAIRTGQVKNIIWGLDFGSLKGTPNRVGNEFSSFPDYLYDQYAYNDFRYLVSLSTLESSYNILQSLYKHQQITTNLDYLNNWNSQATYGRDVLQKLWQEDQQTKQKGIKIYNKIDPSYKAMQISFDQNILPVIQQNPDIKFVIYYPPYSILRYVSIFQEDKSLFYDEMKIKEYIFEQLRNYKNISIYDFQSDKNHTFSLDKYKDFSHHSQEYNEYIINAIARGDKRYLVTPGNYETMSDKLTKQVKGCRIDDMVSGQCGI
ncbi:MAG: hypothetical protein ABFC94_15805 [Syntrophomonas sp.]